ncbi:hypothetical protein Ancab_010612, partial [Ancistrocladus abbreviatus]
VDVGEGSGGGWRMGGREGAVSMAFCFLKGSGEGMDRGRQLGQPVGWETVDGRRGWAVAMASEAVGFWWWGRVVEGSRGDVCGGNGPACFN